MLNASLAATSCRLSYDRGMRPEYVLIVVTAFCWGGYPLIARAAGETGARGTLILMIAGVIPIIGFALAGGGASWPEGRSLLKLSIAGLMMGLGLLAFHRLASSPMDASISIPIVDVAMLLVSAVGAIVFFSEPVTVQKTVGIALMLAGIGMLRPD